MKNLFLLVLSLIAIPSAFAQLPVDTATKKITFSEVIDVPGASKDTLFKRAKNLNMIRANVKADNKAEGTYAYVGKFPVKYPAPQVGMQHSGFVNYKVIIFVKDGKYKYTITDLVHESEKGNGGKLEGKLPECGKFVMSPYGWTSIKTQAEDQMKLLVKKIKENMDPKGDVPKNTGDW